MSATRRAKRLLMPALARLARRPLLTPAELTALRPGRILVVRQHNQMGDMVCATPALRAIAETWPKARIALVTSPANAGVVLHNPHLARVMVLERPLRRLPEFWRELRGWKAELALVLSSVSFSLTSALIGLGSGARHVVGADSRPFGWDFSRHCFSLEMPADPVVSTHAIEHGLAPLRAIGITTGDLSTVVMPVAGRARAGRGDRARAGTRRRLLGPAPGRRQASECLAGREVRRTGAPCGGRRPPRAGPARPGRGFGARGLHDAGGRGGEPVPAV